MQPLVSVMIPCYNSAKTLPLALASLLAQTYTNWECIVVDDGSTDHPIDVVNIVDDPRIRFFRFQENQGRAVARQKALDMAQGKYLCMIDADDWIYPWKLEKQVAIMEAYKDLAILSAGMAIVDIDMNLYGIRRFGIKQGTTDVSTFPPMKVPNHPPVAFAPSMLRTSIAKNYKFNHIFRVSEDKDFLIRVVSEHSFGNISDVLYTYSELTSLNLEKLTSSLRNNRTIFWQHRQRHPLAYWYFIKTLLKELAYKLGYRLGFGDHIITKRSHTYSESESTEFEKAHKIIQRKLHSVFADSV